MKFVHTFIVSNVIPFAIFFRAQIYANISGGFLLVNMNTLTILSMTLQNISLMFLLKDFFLVYQMCFKFVLKIHSLTVPFINKSTYTPS